MFVTCTCITNEESNLLEDLASDSEVKFLLDVFALHCLYSFTPSLLAPPLHPPSLPLLYTLPPCPSSTPSLLAPPLHPPSLPLLYTLPPCPSSTPSLLAPPLHPPSLPLLYTLPPCPSSTPSLLAPPLHPPSLPPSSTPSLLAPLLYTLPPCPPPLHPPSLPLLPPFIFNNQNEHSSNDDDDNKVCHTPNKKVQVCPTHKPTLYIPSPCRHVPYTCHVLFCTILMMALHIMHTITPHHTLSQWRHQYS